MACQVLSSSFQVPFFSMSMSYLQRHAVMLPLAYIATFSTVPWNMAGSSSCDTEASFAFSSAALPCVSQVTWYLV